MHNEIALQACRRSSLASKPESISESRSALNFAPDKILRTRFLRGESLSGTQRKRRERSSKNVPVGGCTGLARCSASQRRFVIGTAPESSSVLALGEAVQNAILRYIAARRSRNQKTHALEPQRRDERREYSTTRSLCVHRVSAVDMTTEKFARAATISTDTDRLQIITNLRYVVELCGTWPIVWCQRYEPAFLAINSRRGKGASGAGQN